MKVNSHILPSSLRPWNVLRHELMIFTVVFFECIAGLGHAPPRWLARKIIVRGVSNLDQIELSGCDSCILCWVGTRSEDACAAYQVTRSFLRELAMFFVFLSRNSLRQAAVGSKKDYLPRLNRCSGGRMLSFLPVLYAAFKIEKNYLFHIIKAGEL